MNASAPPPESSGTALATPPAPQVRVLQPLRLGDPVRWLRAGWRDLLAARGMALFDGICFWLMAVVQGAVFRHLPQYTMSLVSGCFLVGPWLGHASWLACRGSFAWEAPAPGI